MFNKALRPSLVRRAHQARHATSALPHSFIQPQIRQRNVFQGRATYHTTPKRLFTFSRACWRTPKVLTEIQSNMADYESVLKGKYPGNKHAKRVADVVRSQFPNATGVLYLEGRHTKMAEDSDHPEPFRSVLSSRDTAKRGPNLVLGNAATSTTLQAASSLTATTSTTSLPRSRRSSSRLSTPKR